MLRLGFLASHEGSTMQAILDACRSGDLAAEPVLLISNNSRSRCIERATAAGIPVGHLSSYTHPDPAELDAAILAALLEAEVDLVILAGYMKKLGSETLAAFHGRILNSHPALLPDFGGQGMYGDRVHEAVLASGVRESGCTIHLVDTEYDRGPLLAQRRVPVRSGEDVTTLSHRVREAERALYIQVLNVITAAWKPDLILPDEFDPIRVSETLTLREVSLTDVDAVHRWASRPEACRYQAWGPNSPEETRAYVETVIAEPRQRPRRHYAAVIEHTSEGVIGMINLHIRDATMREGEIAYIVHPDHWGHGFATAAARAMTDFAFGNVGLRRAFGTCDPRNEASARVLQKTGMTLETRRQRTVLIRDGWRDSDLYGMSLCSWAARTIRAAELEQEQPLTGGHVSNVRRRGNVVVKPAQRWSRSVQALLEHLHAQGFAACPRPLGIERDEEHVEYIEGEAASGIPAHTVWSRMTLAAIARLLRRFHDASATFASARSRCWQFDATLDAEVICHNDIAPWNTIFRDGEPIAFIDWDTASPGRRIEDVAYALWHFVPLYEPSRCEDLGATGDLTMQAERIREFCTEYGTPANVQLLDEIIRRQESTRSGILRYADQGRAAYRKLVEAGATVTIQREIDHLVQIRAPLATLLASDT